MRSGPLVLAPLVAALAACTSLTSPGNDDRAAPPGPRDVARPVPAREPPPTRIQAAHVLIGFRGSRLADPKVTRTKEEARKLAEEIARKATNEDFTALAQRWSDDPTTAVRGGDLGEFTHDKMVAPFADAAFALRPGEVSGVVETDFGFHVIKRLR